MDESGGDELEALLERVRREVERRRVEAPPVPWPPDARARRAVVADWPRIVDALEWAAAPDRPLGWRRLLTFWREPRRRRRARQDLLVAVRGLMAGLQELERRETELRIDLAAAEELLRARCVRLESALRNVALGFSREREPSAPRD